MKKNQWTDVIDILNLPGRFSDKLKGDMRYILGNNIDSLELIVLFGSSASGTLKVTSDIDLMIITCDVLDQTLRGDIASKLAVPINSVQTDVIFYTIEEIKSGKSLFLKQVMKEGIVLWTKD